MTKQWFDVDRAGLGKQAEQHSKGRLVGELIQNALDEAGVTKIAVSLALVPGRPLADLTVEDDAPEGFRDLSHAYTLYADSYKRRNPEQRGQFNLGEKMALAVCASASISTTKGTVVFDPEEGRIEKSFGIGVLAYLFLIRVGHQEILPGTSWSIGQLQHACRLRIITNQVEHNVKTRLTKVCKAA